MSVVVAAVQMDVAFADRPANLAAIAARLRQAVLGYGAKLVVFPECALTGYCFETFDEALAQAEPLPGPSSEELGALCRELDAYAIYGLLERDGDRLFNALALVGPAGLVATYRKIHLPHLGVDRFATPGDRPFAVVDLGFLRVGMFICYDGGFPESGRVLALLGADLLALPTNWPPGAETMALYGMNTRAMENHVYSLSADRIGNERGFRFIGLSRICEPGGNTLAAADHADEAILVATLDPARARAKRIVRVPDKHVIDRVNDRRPEMYGPLTAPKS